jgi:hypothetical protein
LLDPELLTVEDFLKGTFSISTTLPERRMKNRDSNQNSSFLSVFSSYLLPYSPEVRIRVDPTKEEKIAMENAKQCVLACKISSMLSDLK